MSPKIENTHPHTASCEYFSDALRLGFIFVIDGEPQISHRLTKESKAGNILTGESYDPRRFLLNMVIEFCPFCGMRIYKGVYEQEDEEDQK